MRILLVFLLLFPAAAFAAATPADSDLGRFDGWRAFRVLEQGQHVCYMTAHAAGSETRTDVLAKSKRQNKKAAPSGARDASILLTFRPAESMAPVFTYNAGMVLKEGEASVAAGKERFSLFTARDSAWARTAAVDQSLAKALRAGGVMDISAATKSGALRDRFDLNGADAAYKKIAAACGIP